tara:strand:+ start:1420 stop:1665 length:246 start_codon:yes stop_codon:yes gene_type:complete
MEEKVKPKLSADQVLYNAIDAMMGEITERGWEGMDRYWNRPFSTFLGLILLLQGLNKAKGLELEKQALDLGIISKNEKETP